MGGVAVIETIDLHRSFGDIKAVDGVDLSVFAGEIFAILGPNGAGKTTTVEMLEGYIAPDRGSIRVLGLDPSTAGPVFRDRIGVMLQHGGIEQELTPREMMERLTRLYTRPADPVRLLGMVGLEPAADQRIKTLSGGQRRRLDLAAALAGRPDLLFLDEPTTGFDPSARREAWGVIKDLQDQGVTVLLTTHYLEEAQVLADRVAVMKGGRVIGLGDPDTLGGSHRGTTTIRFRRHPDLDLTSLDEPFTTEGETVVIDATRPTTTLAALLAANPGRELEGLEVRRPGLEEVYLSMVADT